jgi:hypothetical protein
MMRMVLGCVRRRWHGARPYEFNWGNVGAAIAQARNTLCVLKQEPTFFYSHYSY